MLFGEVLIFPITKWIGYVNMDGNKLTLTPEVLQFLNKAKIHDFSELDWRRSSSEVKPLYTRCSMHKNLYNSNGTGSCKTYDEFRNSMFSAGIYLYNLSVQYLSVAIPKSHQSKFMFFLNITNWGNANPFLSDNASFIGINISYRNNPKKICYKEFSLTPYKLMESDLKIDLSYCDTYYGQKLECFYWKKPPHLAYLDEIDDSPEFPTLYIGYRKIPGTSFVPLEYFINRKI